MCMFPVDLILVKLYCPEHRRQPRDKKKVKGLYQFSVAWLYCNGTVSLLKTLILTGLNLMRTAHVFVELNTVDYTRLLIGQIYYEAAP